MSFETDNAAVQELILCTENDGDLYRQVTQAILKNLATKKTAEKYDGEKAVQAFMYLAEAGARAYAKNFDNEKNWHSIFPMSVRRAAATHWRDEFEKEYALGNYDDMIPKKYQKPSENQRPSMRLSGANRKAKPYHAHNVGDEVWWWGFSGTSSSRITGTVLRIHFVGEEPSYSVKIHGAGSVVMKAQHELTSETGRKKLAAQTRAADRRKGRRR